MTCAAWILRRFHHSEVALGRSCNDSQMMSAWQLSLYSDWHAQENVCSRSCRSWSPFFEGICKIGGLCCQRLHVFWALRKVCLTSMTMSPSELDSKQSTDESWFNVLDSSWPHSDLGCFGRPDYYSSYYYKHELHWLHYLQISFWRDMVLKLFWIHFNLSSYLRASRYHALPPWIPHCEGTSLPLETSRSQPRHRMTMVIPCLRMLKVHEVPGLLGWC